MTQQQPTELMPKPGILVHVPANGAVKERAIVPVRAPKGPRVKTEKIMVMGEPGAGKTFQLCKIANWLKSTGAQFYVCDTDDRYTRNLEEFPGLSSEEGGNVHVEDCFTWEDSARWLDNLLESGILVPGKDWIVVDRHEQLWEQAREECDQQTYGKGTTERLFEARVINKRSTGISEKNQSDWQLTKALYMPWYSHLMFESRCNVYLACGVAPIYSGDDSSVKNSFGWIGHKPAGRKDASHWPHTVLFLESGGMDMQGNEQWIVSTAKDASRSRLDRVPLVDLSRQYLAAIAGMTR